MPRTISVQTGARLHFGPLASGAETGRRFGGIGMMIDQPGISVTATESDKELVSGGHAATRERLTRILRALGDHTRDLPMEWQLSSTSPEHAGFGTGTQLSLAVSSILAKRITGTWPRACHLAPQLGRGARSAIGIYGFDQGGFLVDAGQSGPEAIGDLAVRVAVPSEWRILILQRTVPQAGLSGPAELAAFERLPAMSSTLTGRLCRIVLMRVLPALQTGDCEDFTRAVAEYGREVGQYFAPVQSGIFADAGLSQVSPHLQSRLVQSSWGPTVVTFVSSQAEAQDESTKILRELGGGWRCEIARPLNQGAARTET